MHQVAARLGDVDVTVIPLAAKLGDNVVHRSDTPRGTTVPPFWSTWRAVELVCTATGDGQVAACRCSGCPVPPRAARRYTGRLSAGTLSVGDPVLSLPAGTRSKVTVVDTLDDDRPTGVAPLSVSIELEDDIDVGRGDVFVSGEEDATLAGAGA